MPEQLAKTFTARLAGAEGELRSITESEADEPYRAGAWTRKQVVGHLLDSAINNHIRFVMAALDGEYSGPAYDADGWVRMHDYANLKWSMLLDFWRTHNALLAEVVRQIPEVKLNAECRIGKDEPVTLRFVVEDYLDHMDGHIAEITAKGLPRTISA
jgi:hypothetical protein